MSNSPFGDLIPGFPGGNLQDWAFNPLHPTCVKVVTATMVATSLAHLLLGVLIR